MEGPGMPGACSDLFICPPVPPPEKHSPATNDTAERLADTARTQWWHRELVADRTQIALVGYETDSAIARSIRKHTKCNTADALVDYAKMAGT
ncbi:hypothetical protein OSTOST_08634 [Ostertagia ostertagi]